MATYGESEMHNNIINQCSYDIFFLEVIKHWTVSPGRDYTLGAAQNVKQLKSVLQRAKLNTN